MRSGVAWCGAAALFLAPVLAETVLGQQQPQQPEGQRPPSVQVGVPDGRQGGAPAGRQGGRGRQAGPPQPVPRRADGRVLLSVPGRKGVWLPGGGGGQQTTTERSQIPFQPWARAVYADRAANQLEPHTRCKPSGAVRQFLTPYGVEFVEFSDPQRIYVFDIGGPHTYRTIYMDGRTHPSDPTPSFYGHSIGWWEGDTLVVDTTGYNEGFWIDRRGLPTTLALRTLERFTPMDRDTMSYELTINDPGAYTAPFTTRFNLRWEDGTELFEYVCQQANYAHNLMLGAYKSVDRTTVTVP
jgi:hypothetical protein